MLFLLILIAKTASSNYVIDELCIEGNVENTIGNKGAVSDGLEACSTMAAVCAKALLHRILPNATVLFLILIPNL